MSIIRDSIFVSLSNIVGLIFGFFRTPILVRIFKFSPEIFGKFQYLMAIIAMISSYSQFSIDTAYISERKIHTVIERQNFFFWFILITLSVTCISLLIWSVILKSLSIFFQGMILTFSQTFFNAISTNARDEKRFDLLSLARIIDIFASTLIVITVAFFVPNENSLIISTAISLIICFIFLAKKTRWNYIRIRLDKNYIVSFIKLNYAFLSFQTGSSVLNRFSFNSPIFFIRKLFNDRILGFYSIAHRLLILAGNAWSSALSDVFLPYFSKSAEEEATIFRNFLPFSCVIFFLYFSMSILSDIYIKLLFGHDFMDVSLILKILCPWMFSAMVVGPYTNAFLVHQKTGTNLLINIFLIGGRIGAILLGSIWGYKTSLIFFSTISVIFINFMMVLCFRYAKVASYIPLLVIILYQMSLFALIHKGIMYWLGYLAIILDFIILYRRRYFIKDYMKGFLPS